MSLKTWKKEFYNVDASKFTNKRQSKNNTIKAIEHSLKKWQGLTKKNLDKHGLYKTLYEIVDREYYENEDNFGNVNGVLGITDDSCALCQIFNIDSLKDGCKNCPINKNILYNFGCYDE